MGVVCVVGSGGGNVGLIVVVVGGSFVSAFSIFVGGVFKDRGGVGGGSAGCGVGGRENVFVGGGVGSFGVGGNRAVDGGS